jgi:putative endonuclease
VNGPFVPAVYILADRPYGTIYTGVTIDLVRRIREHKCDATPGFTREYRVHTLVYYEICEGPCAALRRVRQLHAESRARRFALIQSRNPTWRDLYPEIA